MIKRVVQRVRSCRPFNDRVLEIFDRRIPEWHATVFPNFLAVTMQWFSPCIEVDSGCANGLVAHADTDNGVEMIRIRRILVHFTL